VHPIQTGFHLWLDFYAAKTETSLTVSTVRMTTIITSVEKGMDTVVVADSDPLERNLVMRYLTDAGYSLLEASNSVEALRIANSFEGEIHLVVVFYPVGIDIARQLAAVCPSIGVLLVCRDSDEQISLRSDLPINLAFLQKPFDPMVLIDKIEYVLNRMR
jgi:two-component system OmpR family response regulator